MTRFLSRVFLARRSATAALLLITIAHWILPLAAYAQEGGALGNCENGRDDDSDGYVDIFDSDCGIVPAAAATCIGPVAPASIGLSLVASSATAGGAALQGADGTNARIQPVGADVDFDGRVEILFASSGEAISILDASTMVAKDTIANAQVGGNQQGLAVGELDPSNGRLEVAYLAFPNPGTALQLRVAWHDGTAWRFVTAAENLNGTDGRRAGAVEDGSAVALADFDADGVAEVYVGASIYRFDTSGASPVLTRLVDCAASAPGGGSRGKQDRGFVASAALDIFAGGALELAAGNQVYAVTTTTPSWSCTVAAELSGAEDGLTAVADLDLDGDLDVVVASDRSDTIYAWDPHATPPALLRTWGTNLTQSGYPTVASVYDDDLADNGLRDGSTVDLPEIVVIVRTSGSASTMRALSLAGAAPTPVTLPAAAVWTLSVRDTSSGHTRIATHDFNNDGQADIVYRDEIELSILYGGPLGPLTPAAVSAATRRYAALACTSATRWEGPIILDIDSDDETEIVVSCRDRVSSFASDTSTTWTDAPAIWHQFVYNPALIQESGRVPAEIQNISSEIPVGSGRRPLNVWMAQNFSMAGAAPGTALLADGAVQPLPGGDTLRVIRDCTRDLEEITLEIRVDNTGGDFPLRSDTPVTFYNGSPAAGGTRIATQTIGTSVGAGTSRDLTFTLSVVGQGRPFRLYWALNDDGSNPASAPVLAQDECDDTNNLGGPGRVCEPDGDGDGIPNAADADSDNDGILDARELAVAGDGSDRSRDRDDDLVPDWADTDAPGFVDANNDGTDDRLDADGDGVPNHLDVDSDDDGIVDLVENSGGALDADRNGRVDNRTDNDQDGLAAAFDADDDNPAVISTLTAQRDTDGTGPADYLDLDADGDGINDLVEAGGTDGDGDGRLAGGDADGDGHRSSVDPDETVPGTPLPLFDTDLDLAADFQDDDADGDGVSDAIEGHDGDGDGVADRAPLGIDLDGDGLDDAYDGDTATGVPAVLPDADSTGGPDYRDHDDDGDGVATGHERFGGAGSPTEQDTDGDGRPDYLDTDDDDDGLATRFEVPDPNSDGDPADARDSDGDLLPDYRDSDDDGDRILTRFENPDPNGNGNPADGRDSDGDLTRDYLDDDDDNDLVLTRFEAPDANGDGNPSDARNSNAVSEAGLPLPDYLDPDDDGDSIATRSENPDPDRDGDPADAQNSDGDLLVDYLDADDDGDTLDTFVELADGAALLPVPSDDVDFDNIDNRLDTDSDGDTVLDSAEGRDDLDADGVPNYLDPDSAPRDTDMDGLRDDVECPAPGNPMTAPGSCRDSDSDGTVDFQDPDDDGDGVPTRDEISFGDSDGDAIDNHLDADDDNDSLPTRDEDLDQNGASGNDDTDGDAAPNYLDADDDNDGIATVVEVADSATLDADLDGDGIPPWLDTNSDGDGTGDASECPSGASNGGNSCPDADSDSVPGYLDADEDAEDTDGDGVPDSIECPDPLTGCPDTDNDGTLDFNDPDDDGDGVPTRDERPRFLDEDSDDDSLPNYLDPDDDGDRVPTASELGAGAASSPQDSDGDGTPDFLDSDDDDDGVPTATEVQDSDALGDSDVDRDGRINWLDADADGDGSRDGDEADDVDGSGTPDYLEASGGLAGGALCSASHAPSPSNWLLLLFLGLWLRRRQRR